MDDSLTEDRRSSLIEKQAELIKLLTALSTLSESKEWSVLKELVFDRALGDIERQMLNSSKETPIDLSKLYRLQGELVWAKKYSDVNRFVESLKLELKNIKNLLK